MHSKGFTLVELIIVILIIGILAAIAAPKLLDLGVKSEDSKIDYTIGSVKSGIAMYAMQSQSSGRTPVYPASLDSSAGNYASSSNPFFTEVLDKPVTDSYWYEYLDGMGVYNYLAYRNGRWVLYYQYHPDTGVFSLMYDHR